MDFFFAVVEGVVLLQYDVCCKRDTVPLFGNKIKGYSTSFWRKQRYSTSFWPNHIYLAGLFH